MTITEMVTYLMKRRRESYIKMIRRQKTLSIVVSRETNYYLTFKCLSNMFPKATGLRGMEILNGTAHNPLCTMTERASDV